MFCDVNNSRIKKFKLKTFDFTCVNGVKIKFVIFLPRNDVYGKITKNDFFQTLLIHDTFPKKTLTNFIFTYHIWKIQNVFVQILSLILLIYWVLLIT